MEDFILLPREGLRDGNVAPASLPFRDTLASLLSKRVQDKHEQSPTSFLPQPSSVARHVSSIASRLSDSVRSHVGQSLMERRLLRLRNERKQILELRMANAESYEEWEAAAHQLDELEEHEDWKASGDSGDNGDFYNPDFILSRLRELEDARQSSDVRRMLHLVRTALSRDVGGISSAGLYSHTHSGTKRLVERYIKASVDLIHTLVDHARRPGSLPKGLTHREMLDELLLARRSYGRSALVLSGGSVYGMAHIGVLKALFDRGLLPKIISGTSAGSIVAAVVCTRTDEEIPPLLQRFAHGDLAVFTDKDNPDSWVTHIGRALRYGAWHDSRHIARVMRDHMGDITFQEAFNRTRRILNITVSSKPGLQLPPLLNYLTAPDVIIWSAVVASCSIPGVFDPRPLLVRDAETGRHVPWDPAEQLWIDGSLDNDVPVERLGEMLNVNHFIVSQTNPHIVLFVSGDDKNTSSHGRAPSAIPSIADIVYTLGWLTKSEAIYYLETLVDMGVFRGGASMLLKMLNQRYTADINIFPRMSLAWGTNLIRNPTPEFMLEACRVGEQATWPSIPRIEQACAVEVALDKAVHTMRETIAFSDSQVNLRRFITGSYELGVRGRHLTGVPPLTSGPVAAAVDAQTCTVDSNDGDTDPTSVNNMMSPLATHLNTGLRPFRSQSPVVHHPSQYNHHKKHKRRGSGGSIQLSARRRHNRHALETILSEDGGGQDSDYRAALETEPGYAGSSDDSGMSLSARRGMADIKLSQLPDAARPKLTRSISYGAPNGNAPPGAFFGTPPMPIAQSTPFTIGDEVRNRFILPPFRGSMKQNSLQQLPMSTPFKGLSPTASFTRKGYNWDFGERAAGGTGTRTTPISTLGHDVESPRAAAGDESPVLLMKARQRRERRHSSASSAVSAVSAAAAAAVVAAHQAVMQAVVNGSGVNGGGGGAPTSLSEPQSPQAQRAQLRLSSSSIPALSRVSSTNWYPGVLDGASGEATSEETMEDADEEELEDEEEYDDGYYDNEEVYAEDDTSGDFDLPTATPPLPRRSKSVPALVALNAQDGQGRWGRAVLPRTPPSKLMRAASEESVEHDHTDEDGDAEEGEFDEKRDNDDGSDVFMSSSAVQRPGAKTTAAQKWRTGDGDE